MAFPSMSQVSAGPKIQLNFSSVTGGDNDADNNFKLGFNAGVFLNIAATEMVDVHPEMLYSTRGYRRVKSIGTKDTNLLHILSYIDFPFLANIHIGDNAFIEAGPQIGYLINDKTKGQVVSSSTIYQIDTGNVYGYKTTEYSLVLGGGYKFNFGMSAALRLNYGITKLYDANSLSRNISFGVSVSYWFGGDSGVGGRGGGVVYKRI